MRVAGIHQRITNVRCDFMHKITTRLARENQTCVIEDLNIIGMMRGRVARAVSDVGFGLFRQFLTYKCLKYGSEVVVADRFFASSKRCHGCGHKKEFLARGEKTYRCESCGLVCDRDRNAALNLEQYPRLAGNWYSDVPTPGDEPASTRRTVRRASRLKTAAVGAAAKSQELKRG